MKNIKIILLKCCFLFMICLINKSLLALNEDSLLTPKHAIGAGAGFITGYGLSYRYSPGKFGLQLNMAPYYDKVTERYSLGLTFLYTLIKNRITSLYLYEGNHYYYNATLIETWDPSKQTSISQRQVSKYMNNGVGFGIEIIAAKRIGFNLMTGYAFYNNFEQLNITGEIAVYYKF